MEEKSKRADFKEILAALKLTAGDVEANRQAQFLPVQLRSLKSQSGDNGCLLGFLMLAVLPLLCCMFPYIQRMFTPGSNYIGIDVIFIGFMFVVIFVVTFFSQLKFERDQVERRVASATGVLQTERVSNKGYYTYYLQIASVRHRVSEEAYHLLKTREGESFTVYFWSHSKAFLSLEPANRRTSEVS